LIFPELVLILYELSTRGVMGYKGKCEYIDGPTYDEIGTICRYKKRKIRKSLKYQRMIDFYKISSITYLSMIMRNSPSVILSA